MRKCAIVAAASIVLSFVFAGPLSAQPSLSWNWGVITDKSLSFSPFLWTNGVAFDIDIGLRLSITPEVYLTIRNFDFGQAILIPSAVLTLYSKGTFIAAGVAKSFRMGAEIAGNPVPDVSCKLNVGLRGDGMKFTLMIYTPFDAFLKEIAIGGGVGFFF